MLQALREALLQGLFYSLFYVLFCPFGKTHGLHDWDGLETLKVLKENAVMTAEYLNSDLSLDVENLFLGLAWLGEATTMQIHRLWRPRPPHVHTLRPV